MLDAAPSLPVVPTAIDGAWELLKNKLFPIPFGTRVKVRFSDPLDRVEGEEPTELLVRARGVIEDTLDEWRADDV